MENKSTQVNFVGGKLKLKNQKTDRSMKEVKKVITKDISKVKKEPAGKDIDNDKIIANLNDDEENYLNELANQAKGGDNENNSKNKNNKRNIPETVDYRTEAEKLFEERRMKNLPEKMRKNLIMSYKERYEKFNKTLSKLPEHYDIPKVGPG